MRRKGEKQNIHFNKHSNSAIFEKKKCVIGIDQSYARTGLSIAVDGKLKLIKSINFKNTKTKSAKRKNLYLFVKKAVEACVSKYGKDEVVVVIERIRLYTQTNIFGPNYIKAESSLGAVIIDAAAEYEIETFSVDTRAWKSKILGSSKPLIEPMEGVKNPQKVAAIKFIISLGFEEEITCRKRNGGFAAYNDDAADSACIALYGFTEKPMLKREL